MMVQQRVTVDGVRGEWEDRGSVFRSNIAAGHHIAHLSRMFAGGPLPVTFEFRFVPTNAPVNCD